MQPDATLRFIARLHRPDHPQVIGLPFIIAAVLGVDHREREVGQGICTRDTQLLQGGGAEYLQQGKPEGPLDPTVAVVQAQMGEFMSQHRRHRMHIHAQQIEHAHVDADDIVIAVDLAGKRVGLIAVHQDQGRLGLGDIGNTGFDRIDIPHLMGIHPLQDSPVPCTQNLLWLIAPGEGPDLP